MPLIGVIASHKLILIRHASSQETYEPNAHMISQTETYNVGPRWVRVGGQEAHPISETTL